MRVAIWEGPKKGLNSGSLGTLYACLPCTSRAQSHLPPSSEFFFSAAVEPSKSSSVPDYLTSTRPQPPSTPTRSAHSLPLHALLTEQAWSFTPTHLKESSDTRCSQHLTPTTPKQSSCLRATALSRHLLHYLDLLVSGPDPDPDPTLQFDLSSPSRPTVAPARFP